MINDVSNPAKLIALMLQGHTPERMAMEMLPREWREVARCLAPLEKGERVKALETKVLDFENAADLRNQVYTEIRAMDQPAHRKTGLGDPISKPIAEQISEFPVKSPDEDLRRAILQTLEGPTKKGERRPSMRLRSLAAGKMLLDWMEKHGQFVQSEAQELFYFWRDDRTLFGLDTDRFAAWLYALTGANPAGTNYAFLLADCKTVASSAEKRPVVRLAAWDKIAEVLRVSRFDGTVYVLDGEQIREEGNGEGEFIFADSPIWAPYEPEFDNTPGAALQWWSSELPNWEGGERQQQMYGLALRAWLLTAFFSELCPAKPLLVLKGEMGSGKSSLMRTMLRLVFGSTAQVGGVPDKPDGFTAWAASEHFIVIDNLDQFVGWLRDKLARISTGTTDSYRKLYSNNEVG
ncbi:MAG: hypothetical protein JXA89_07490, partial [Anaerolineae bacterium]|nr:hypothetical protein [Anaerolineae bacterium]